MRWQKAKSNGKALAVCLFACACGLTPGASEPSGQDVINSFRVLVPGQPVIDATVNQCRAGSVAGADGNGDVAAQVCNFCVVGLEMGMVGGQFSGGGTKLIVSRAYGTATFTRALSAATPNVRPAKGERGVWVIVPTSLQKVGEAIETQLPDSLATRAGFQSQTGFNAGFGMMGDLPDAVITRFMSDTDLSREAATVVGRCEPEAMQRDEIEAQAPNYS